MVINGQQIAFVIVLLAIAMTTTTVLSATTVSTAPATTTTAETVSTTHPSSPVTTATSVTTTASATTSTPAATVLLAVAGLAVSNTSTAGLTLTWIKPVGDGHVYTVSYKREDGPTNSNSTEAETFEFSGLLPGYNYTFNVTYEVKNATEESPAAWIAFVLAPEEPKNITVLQYTTALTLTWEKPAGKVDKYVFSLNGTIKGNTTTEKLEVTGLLAGTIYMIGISSVSNGKESQEEVLHAATRPEQLVKMLKAEESTSSSVLLTVILYRLNPDYMISIHYKIEYGTEHTYSIQRFPMPASGDANVNVTNLSPGTKYSFTGYTELHAVESELSTGSSAFDSFYTRNSSSEEKTTVNIFVRKATKFGYAAPQNLTVNEMTRGTTQVGITWDPFGDFTEFVLHCNDTAEVAVKTTSGECNNLTPGSIFTAYVVTKANKDIFQSEPSEILTSITVPLQPKTFTASASTSTTIHLAWTKDEGNLRNWMLKMDPAEGSTEFSLSLENTQTTHYIDGLTPGRLFNFSMFAQSKDPVTNETFDSSVTFVDERTYPEVPENITILGTSESSLDVAWDAPNGDVSFYNVTVCPADSSSPCKPAVNTTGTSFNLTNLEPAGLKWTVKVTAVSGKKESQSSLDQDTFTYPLQLLSLIIDDVMTTNVTLTWKHDSGDKAETLLLRWEPQTSTGPMNFPSTSASQVITGLTPGQGYVFFMKAMSGQWNSTEINNATTMVPVSPSNLMATITKPHQLAVSWNVTEGLYDSFMASINPGPSNGSATIDTNTTDAEFINLVPGTEYTVTVFTKAGDRESETVWQSFNTSETEPGPPRNLTLVEPANSRFFTVRWEDPLKKNGWIELYVISVALPSGVLFSLNTSKNETTERKKTIIGLTPATEYTVYVKAVNGAGAGQTSENISVTTGEEASGVVSNLTVTKDTAFSMMISWGHPLVPHGNILHYVLEVRLSTGEAKCQQVVLFNCSDCPAMNETDAVLGKVITPCYPRDNDVRVDGVGYQDEASVTYNVASLSPFTEYIFTVYPVSRPGLGNLTSVTETTEEYYPGMVGSINVTDITSTTFVVSWAAPEEPNGNIMNYNISTEDISTGDTEFFSTDSTQTLIDNRKMFSDYNVKVRANTKIGPGNWSEEQLVRTEEGAPAEVQNLTAEARSSSSLALSWEQPAELNGILRNYVINYTYKADFEDITNSTEVSNATTNYILDGLTKWTFYNVAIAAVTVKAGPSRSLVVRTDEDVPDGPPKMVEAGDVTSTSIKLSWQPPETPNGFITKYTVEYKDVDAQPKRSKETTDNSTSLVIDGLQSHKLYAFSVCANTSKGQGPCSDEEEWRTDQDKPSPPQDVLVVDTNSTYFIIRWESPATPNGIILEYEVIATMLADSTETKNTTNQTELLIVDLTPYNNYSIKVRAKTIKGFGNWSDVIYKVTLEDLPDEPQTLTAAEVQPYALVLKWDAPLRPNGIIIKYTIKYGMKNGNISTANVNGTVTSIRIGSLLACRSYDFKVAAHTKVGPGNFSVLKVSTSNNTPSKPYNLDLKPLTSTSLRLIWTKPNETCEAKYTIKVREDNPVGEDKLLETRPEFNIVDNGAPPRTSSVDITDLRIYTLYYIEIEVVIGSKRNVSDKTEKIRTKEFFAGPVTDFKTRVCDDCYTSVQAEWKPPSRENGKITFYIITWKLEGFDKEYDKSLPAESVSVNITENIWSETKYLFTIQAQNGAGLGNKSFSNVEIGSGPAVPVFTDPAMMTRTIAKDTTDVEVDKWQQFAINLEEQLFDMKNGEVTKIGVFVAESKNGNKIPKVLKIPDYQFPTWHDTLGADGNPKATYYMIKPWEQPPSSWKKVTPSRRRRAIAPNIVIIGENTAGCSGSNGEQQYCNAPLQPDTEYCVAVGAYTKWGFHRTPCAEFRTGAAPFPLTAVVAGVTCALLIIIMIIIIVFIVKRKRRKRGDRETSDGVMIELGTKTPLNGEDNDAFIITDESGDEVTVEKPPPINVRSFPAIESQMHHDNDKLLKWQFKLLEKVSPYHTSERAVETAAVKAKNRYINILPFDHTLVRLNMPEGESRPEAGYTNANYIPGNNHRKEYMACQGPLNRTIDDFWQMVWEQNISTIIMLTKCVESGKEKCARYWPSDQHPVIRGDLQVQLQSESFMEDYAIRILELSDLQSEKTRKVMQFHFLSWPDWDKPDSAYYLLNFVDVVKNHRRTSDTGPKLVHCSAGIGRTGTYITVERLLEQITRQPKISIFDTILDLRESRKGMVQGVKQYTYIHECLKDAIEQRLARKQIHKSSPTIASQNGNMQC
ncbi:receptor-type tyrosine-protein phosphatase eta-like [Lineus longissimus]|uniref:receptor-type tyrosine-protein phosphatase eta-like n=1 Tax=Lineus longissimus TaxID=88925 RepID=UPI00315CB83F